MTSGRRVPDRDTDQAGSEMLLRTVTIRGIAELCVSPEAAGGSADAAQREAEQLASRGYLPPAAGHWRRPIGLRRVISTGSAAIWDGGNSPRRKKLVSDWRRNRRSGSALTWSSASTTG